MKLSSSQLEAFYAVAKTRSFTKAAESIHITQSALSQRILNLEGELQTSLFIRDRAGIELTEAAQGLLRYCQLQEQFEAEFLGRLKSSDAKELAGVIRIAGFSSVMRSVVLPTLKDIITQNPRVRLEVHTKELYELLPMLKRGEVDFIFTDAFIDREEIESVPLGVERNVLIEASHYSGPDVYLDHDERDETTLRYLKLARKKISRLDRHYLDDVYGIIDGVRLGLGRAVAPQHLVSGLKGVRVRNPRLALEVPVVLHFFKQPYYSALHDQLLETFKSNTPELLKRT